MSMAWVAVGTAVLGAGVSIAGQKKQAKANQAALNSNNENQAEQNRLAWANYLMTRGINPSGAETGVIPTNPQKINSKLPLWATMKRAVPAGGGAASMPVGLISDGSNIPTRTPSSGLATGVNNGRLVYGGAGGSTGGGGMPNIGRRGGFTMGPQEFTPGGAFPDITMYSSMKGRGSLGWENI